MKPEDIEIKYCNFNVCKFCKCKYFMEFDMRQSEASQERRLDGVHVFKEKFIMTELSDHQISVDTTIFSDEGFYRCSQMSLAFCTKGDNYSVLLPKDCPNILEQVIIGNNKV